MNLEEIILHTVRGPTLLSPKRGMLRCSTSFSLRLGSRRALRLRSGQALGLERHDFGLDWLGRLGLKLESTTWHHRLFFKQASVSQLIGSRYFAKGPPTANVESSNLSSELPCPWQTRPFARSNEWPQPASSGFSAQHLKPALATAPPHTTAMKKRKTQNPGAFSSCGEVSSRPKGNGSSACIQPLGTT